MLNFIQQTLFSLPEVNQLKQIYMCKVHAVQYPDSAVVDSFEPCLSRNLRIVFQLPNTFDFTLAGGRPFTMKSGSGIV